MLPKALQPLPHGILAQEWQHISQAEIVAMFLFNGGGGDRPLAKGPTSFDSRSLT
jgi:hypothetical protein